MRIAVLANTAWYLSNFRCNLMLALQAAGHEVLALAPADAAADRIKAAGIEFLSIPLDGSGTNPFRELNSVLAIRRVLRKKRIDVVLSYTPKGNLYAALSCISLGIRFIPNVSGLGQVFIRKSWLTRVVKTLYRLTFRRAQHVFFQNLDDMQIFLDAGLVARSQAERLPGSGVDLTRFTPLPAPPTALDAPVFLLVARMLWDKGVGEYATAARRIHEQHPQARFQLLGFVGVANPAAIPREQIDAWVDAGTVEYLGATDDVRPFLQQADCVVLPSYYREGVPRSLLEAAASARPVITTDAPGCRDTVADGVTGYLCKTADADDLTAKLMQFIALPLAARRSMGEQARFFVERHFDEKIVLRRYLEVIRGLTSA